jgi:hypothetical protein
MLRKILQAERDQVADYARVNAAITSAETKIAALKTRNFGPDEMRIAIVTIRDRAILTIRDVRKNMARRADEAGNLQESLTDDFVRQRLRFAKDDVTDADLRASLFATLERTPTYSLLDHLRKAIEAEDVARAESIRFEFQSRDDRHEYAATFGKILAKLAPLDRAEMRKRLANIRNAAEMADARITDLFAGTRGSIAALKPGP